MINEETQREIDIFLNELSEILSSSVQVNDFRFLYEKYPLVRIGIRRAILTVKKRNYDAFDSGI